MGPVSEVGGIGEAFGAHAQERERIGGAEQERLCQEGVS